MRDIARILIVPKSSTLLRERVQQIIYIKPVLNRSLQNRTQPRQQLLGIILQESGVPVQ
ncbi:hypothetical protein D3C75_1333830 [compost metagenome]